MEDGDYHAYLQSSSDQMLTPFTKFAMDVSESIPDLVHLRSCYNNKYLVRNASDGDWIVVAGNEVEEDQSKWSCTFFKFISLEVDGESNTNVVVRLQHIQNKQYVAFFQGAASVDNLSSIDTTSYYASLSQNSSARAAGDLSDTYTITY